jgi:hypothetical protein
MLQVGCPALVKRCGTGRGVSIEGPRQEDAMENVRKLNAVELLLELTFTEATPDNSDYASALTNEVKGRGLAFSNPVKENSPIGRFTFSLGSQGSKLAKRVVYHGRKGHSAKTRHSSYRSMPGALLRAVADMGLVFVSRQHLKAGRLETELTAAKA